MAIRSSDPGRGHMAKSMGNSASSSRHRQMADSTKPDGSTQPARPKTAGPGTKTTGDKFPGSMKSGPRAGV